MVGYGEIRAKQFEPIIVKLSSVVRDDYLKNSKSTNDVFPHKVFGVPLSDLGDRLCFYSLCEIVNGDN